MKVTRIATRTNQHTAHKRWIQYSIGLDWITRRRSPNNNFSFCCFRSRIQWANNERCRCPKWKLNFSLKPNKSIFTLTTRRSICDSWDVSRVFIPLSMRSTSANVGQLRVDLNRRKNNPQNLAAIFLFIRTMANRWTNIIEIFIYFSFGWYQHWMRHHVATDIVTHTPSHGWHRESAMVLIFSILFFCGFCAAAQISFTFMHNAQHCLEMWITLSWMLSVSVL